ncbi:hypothetical protein DFH09DRAFT_1498319 [Mycena vulgaris]|nr:hypothetical protein DFH09DRAFT_1498319 [Mycena vulgaris]
MPRSQLHRHRPARPHRQLELELLPMVPRRPPRESLWATRKAASADTEPEKAQRRQSTSRPACCSNATGVHAAHAPRGFLRRGSSSAGGEPPLWLTEKKRRLPTRGASRRMVQPGLVIQSPLRAPEGSNEPDFCKVLLRAWYIGKIVVSYQRRGSEIAERGGRRRGRAGGRGKVTTRDHVPGHAGFGGRSRNKASPTLIKSARVAGLPVLAVGPETARTFLGVKWTHIVSHY